MGSSDIQRPAPNGYGPAWVILAAALVVRLFHIYFTTRYNPLSENLTLDAAIYERWARTIVWGGEPEPTNLMQSPLYPWFIAIVYRIFGSSLTALRCIQAVLGAFSCSFVMIITKRLLRSTAAALIAGAAAAFYLPLIFYEGVLVPATILIFLNLLFVTLVVAGDKPPGAFRLIIAGLVLGIAAVTKPISMLLFPFAILHIFLSTSNGEAGKRADTERAAPAMKRAVVFTAGVIIACAPLTIRNARLTGEFIPFTTGGGINFFIGNNENANGFYAVPVYRNEYLGATPGRQLRNMHRIASAETGRELSPKEVSEFWFQKGFEYINENKRNAITLQWLKTVYFWNEYERANVESFTFHRMFPGILRAPLITFGLIAPLGLLGLFLTRNRWRSLWLLYGGVLAYLLAALIFYVLSRYRLPVVPFLLPFAGACICEIFSLARHRRFGELTLVIAAAATLFYFVNLTVAFDTPEGSSINYTRLGNGYVARGDTMSAAAAYREAVRLHPKNSTAQENLELLLRKQNK